MDEIMNIIIYATFSTLAGFAVALAYYMWRGGKRADRVY